MSEARNWKLERLQNGDQPRTLDLFAGCGGFSLGFEAAGFESAGAVEQNRKAMRTYAKNILNVEDGPLAQARDITEESAEDLSAELGVTFPSTAVDVIIGGPPCQVYTRVGRAKLRQVEENPEAFLKDARGSLYLRLLEYVRQFDPLVVVVENVPDMLDYGGVNVAEEICATLEDLNYDCAYTMLNAASYGVPQFRERVFLCAYARELEADIRFPAPTHRASIPSGYKNQRGLLKSAGNDRGRSSSKPVHYQEVRGAESDDLPEAVTAKEATRDLPEHTRHLDDGFGRKHQRFDTLAEYRNLHSLNVYQKLMRNWGGYENENGGVYDHVVRNTPRDFETFRAMRPGEEYPKALERARERLLKRIDRERRKGERVPEGSPLYERLKSEIVPPYDPSKFKNKWHKMRPNQPCRTLTAHLGKDTYSHIHYDKHQARMISVREAARLQSFPDGFQFSGGMGAAFRQIGNSVPPLVAKIIAEEVRRQLPSRPAVNASLLEHIGDEMPTPEVDIRPTANVDWEFNVDEGGQQQLRWEETSAE